MRWRTGRWCLIDFLRGRPTQPREQGSQPRGRRYQSPGVRASAKIGRTVAVTTEIAHLNPPQKNATLGARRSAKEKLVIDAQACVPVPPHA